MGRRCREEVAMSIVMVLLTPMLVSLVRCDINKDKEECANQLVGLATCLPYVSGEAKSPTQDCCTGLNQVLKSSKKCVCVLVRDRNDPSLGLKINASLALALPHKCKAPDGDISECPALLHLAPNSPEAKIFTDFGKAAAPTSSAPPPAGTGSSNVTSAKEPSKTGGSKRWSMHGSIVLWIFVVASNYYLSFDVSA